MYQYGTVLVVQRGTYMAFQSRQAVARYPLIQCEEGAKKHPATRREWRTPVPGVACNYTSTDRCKLSDYENQINPDESPRFPHQSGSDL